MTLLCVLLIGFVSLACAQQEIEPLEFGSVAGEVVDQNGKPAKGVQISALPMEKTHVMGKVIYAVSGPDGKFVLSQVQSGLNMICFAKETELYPDTRFSASTDDLSLNPIVKVKRDETTTGVIIQLGRKGVKIIGKIVDKRTGLIVQKTGLLLYWSDEPSKSVETTAALDGTFEFVVAPKPLRLEVSAPGYKHWVSPVILAGPGETKELRVNLEPVT
jgi:hypothetical protein